jgi:hypothetical protein
MLFGWDDLYLLYAIGGTVGGERRDGVRYCIMGGLYGGMGVMPNPYFRDLAGWLDVRPITDATRGVLTITANSPVAYKYARNDEESFYITAVRRAGRNADVPGNGLAIWHVYTKGDNTTTQGFPLVKFIQADAGRTDPLGELAENPKFFSAPPSDYYDADNYNTSFSRRTSPAAVWHDGTPSNLNISDISEIGMTMTFKANGSSASKGLAQSGAVSVAQPGYGIGAARQGNITFRVPSAGRVSVKMYDAKGRMAATLFDGERNPGTYSVSIPPRVGTGVYFVKMAGDGYSENIKLFRR